LPALHQIIADDNNPEISNDFAAYFEDGYKLKGPRESWI
jgi:hypothetical protein